MPYRQVWTSLWAEDWFLPLSPAAKLLYLHLLTSPGTRPSGVLEHSQHRVARDLGITQTEIQAATEALAEKVIYFEEIEAWWVPRFSSWQGRGPKWAKCVEQDIAILSPDLRKALRNHTPSDTLWHTLSDTPRSGTISKVTDQQQQTSATDISNSNSRASAKPQSKPTFEIPEDFIPLTKLPGYKVRNHAKAFANIKAACTDANVDVADVVRSFAAEYNVLRHTYAWVDPVAALKGKPLAIAISKVLGGESHGSSQRHPTLPPTEGEQASKLPGPFAKYI